MNKTTGLQPPRIYSKQPPEAKGGHAVDAVLSMVRELVVVQQPHLKGRSDEINQEAEKLFKQKKTSAIWVYFPWLDRYVHTLSEQDYFALRTSRNRNIIDDVEQKAFRGLSVGIAGLSVGASTAYALVQSGGPKTLSLADFDVLETTNLNRLRGGMADLGSPKLEVLAKQLWELDPFLKLKLFEQGLNKQNLESFIKPLDVFVDEMDNIELKVRARFICRKLHIPVLMATDNGDGVILDVERFDESPNRLIFHGLLGNVRLENFGELSFPEWLKLATKIVGPEFLTERMEESLLSMGKTVSAVPQLGTTAAMAGAAISFALRRLAAKQSLPSGRHTFGLESVLVPGYTSAASVKARKKKTKEFIERFAR